LSEENKPTLVAIGKTGTGKSTVCNAFLQGEMSDDIPELFRTSANINAVTYETIKKDGKLFNKENENYVTIVDTPGLSEGEAEDANHIVNMVKFLKKEVILVSMFLFTVNGQEPRFDSGTKLLIKVFENSFGKKFWDHFCILYTRWGNSSIDIQRRKKSKITEESRK